MNQLLNNILIIILMILGNILLMFLFSGICVLVSNYQDKHPCGIDGSKI